MTEIVQAGSPDNNLSELQAWIQTNEATWGPIFKIGNDGEKTGGSFHWNDAAHPKPTRWAKVRLSLDGAAPSGTDKLCDGLPFISGALQSVVVYRERD